MPLGHFARLIKLYAVTSQRPIISRDRVTGHELERMASCRLLLARIVSRLTPALLHDQKKTSSRHWKYTEVLYIIGDCVLNRYAKTAKLSSGICDCDYRFGFC